jgi:hypothetical protein
LREIKAPNDPQLEKRVFLAGSIEQGKAIDWQQDVANVLATKSVVILNPRREVWDPTLEQDVGNDVFWEQVNWELDMLASADIIAMYFQEDTLSPISLLELGLFASSGKLLVYCPPGFWRKGNVDVVCIRENIPHTSDYDMWITWLKVKCGK